MNNKETFAIRSEGHSGWYNHVRLLFVKERTADCEFDSADEAASYITILSKDPTCLPLFCSSSEETMTYGFSYFIWSQLRRSWYNKITSTWVDKRTTQCQYSSSNYAHLQKKFLLSAGERGICVFDGEIADQVDQAHTTQPSTGESKPSVVMFITGVRIRQDLADVWTQSLHAHVEEWLKQFDASTSFEAIFATDYSSGVERCSEYFREHMHQYGEGIGPQQFQFSVAFSEISNGTFWPKPTSNHKWYSCV